jgi:predicted small secreted protein
MLSTARPTFRRALVVFLILVAAATVAACGGSAAGPGGGDVGEGPVGGPAATMAPAAPQPGSDGEEQPGGQDGNPRPAPANLLIIKTGTMTLQVAGMDTAITAATQQIDALGGYASASQRAGDGDDAYASITFRIPVARWEEALTGLRGLAEKVLDEQTGTQDVTDQVVDLAARIRNLQATEAALQAIMAQAKEIKDVLAVQAQLTETRGEIERLTAEKGNFEAQAAFSTLTVAFSLKPNPVLAETKGFDPATEVDQASASLVGVLQALATAGIWFAIVWVPILLSLAIVVVVGLAVARRVRRRLDTDVATPAPTAGSGA